MNLGDMVDEVMTLVPAKVEPAEVIKLLNRCQEREARDLAIPQYYVEATSVSAAFSLPSGARGDGLLEVRRNEDGLRFPIYTSQQADLAYPAWKDWDVGDTLFIVFDPKVVGGDGLIRPVPLPGTDSQSYYITYVSIPDEMTDLTDQPWNGIMDSYHQMLVYYVVYQLMFRAGDERWQAYFAQYTDLKRDAFQATDPRVLFGNNPTWKAVRDAG